MLNDNEMLDGGRRRPDVYGATDIGLHRQVNQDQFLIGTLTKALLIHDSSGVFGDRDSILGRDSGTLILVADGVGGAVAGEQASAFAVDSVARYVLSFLPWWAALPQADDDLRVEMESAVAASEIGLRDLEHQRPEVRGLGTTLTMAFIVWPTMYVVHVGDSRCYVDRNGKLEQVTRDHTVAQQLADEGVIDQGDVEMSPLSSVLWNAVGGDDTLAQPEIYKVSLQEGDTVLICTDGLTKHVADDEIARLLGSGLEARKTCEVLVGAANEAGGSDNITVVVARFPA